MRALIGDKSAAGGMKISEVADPKPKSGEVLIQVAASSVNFGEMNRVRNGQFEGEIPGWEAAGTVVDGGGVFSAGDRVLTRAAAGGWAEFRVASVADCAAVPDGIDLGVAATLPVAAGTAYRALQRSGSLLGKTVLVTGASGGVGRFAVQLAARAGARVIASVGSEPRKAGLSELGADEVVIGVPSGPVDVVLDNVGGQQLVDIYALLAQGGIIQCIGWTSLEPATFPPYSLVGPKKSLDSFQMGDSLGQDLAYLLGLIKDGSLKAEIGWRGSWENFSEAADLMFSRRLAGKAVLEIEAN